MKIKPYFQLSRPANVVTAVADILAGVVLASTLSTTVFSNIQGIILLCISTAGLYAGGIVFNDIFDLKLDKKERPERVIPSGKVSKKQALLFGISLFLIAILASWVNNSYSVIIATLILICALFYDKYGKHSDFWGPLNMGLCRGGNLLLGISILPLALIHFWYLSLIPIAYIAAITLISRGEVHGGNRRNLYLAAVIFIGVSISQISFGFLFQKSLLTPLIVVVHLLLLFKPLIQAIKNPIGPNIGKAVKSGVLTLIVMDAAWVSVSGNLFLAIFVLCLLPLSIWLARYFAVT